MVTKKILGEQVDNWGIPSEVEVDSIKSDLPLYNPIAVEVFKVGGPETWAPVEVTKDGELRSGAHRLQAAKELGLEKIAATVVEAEQSEKGSGLDSYTKEMYDHYQQRTKEHIDRVIKNMMLLDGYEGFTKGELETRGRQHDADKYDKDKMVPYIWVTEYYRVKNSGAEVPEDLNKKYGLTREATGEHVKHSDHHPEAHAKPDDMTKLDLIEMCCDWKAMSQEKGENGGSPKAWADKMVNKKWNWNKENTEFIYKTIAELDQKSAKDSNQLGESLDQVVYHGSNNIFDKFTLDKTAQGLIWFASSKEAVKSGDVGVSCKYIYSLKVNLKKPAGWEEYDKKGLGQLVDMGYDGAILPNSDGSYVGFVFKPSQVKILSREQIKENSNQLEEDPDRRLSIGGVSDEELEAALEFMKGVGLVPTGKGKPTLPSTTPPFSLVWDKDEEIYFLVTKVGRKGDIWEVKEDGEIKYVGGYSGSFTPGKNQDEYSDAEFADYVPLAVIQAVYGTLDPDFNKEPDLEEQLGSLMLKDREKNYKKLQGLKEAEKKAKPRLIGADSSLEGLKKGWVKHYGGEIDFRPAGENEWEVWSHGKKMQAADAPVPNLGKDQTVTPRGNGWVDIEWWQKSEGMRVKKVGGRYRLEDIVNLKK